MAAKAGAAGVPKVNLFAKAATVKTNAKKPVKGTKIELPVRVGEDKELEPALARLHDSLSRIIQAADDDKKAKNKSDIAKADLRPYVEDIYANELVKYGRLPETPVTIVNHKNESVTYVVQDRSASAALDDTQVALLDDLFGEDVRSEIAIEMTEFAFDINTMLDVAGDVKPGVDIKQLPKVQDVVAELLSDAIINCDKLTDEQKANLITAKARVRLRPGVLGNLIQYTGQDTGKVKAFFTAVGSSVIRYFKA